MPSSQTGTPPASSIFIIIDVPDRGSPETTITGRPYMTRRYVRCHHAMNRLQLSGIVPVLLGIPYGAHLQHPMKPQGLRRPALVGVCIVLAAVPAEAYVGPGAGFALLSSFLVVFTTIILAFVSLLIWPFRLAIRAIRRGRAGKTSHLAVHCRGARWSGPETDRSLHRRGQAPELFEACRDGQLSPPADNVSVGLPCRVVVVLHRRFARETQYFRLPRPRSAQLPAGPLVHTHRPSGVVC